MRKANEEILFCLDCGYGYLGSTAAHRRNCPHDLKITSKKHG